MADLAPDPAWTTGRFAVLDVEGNGHHPPDLVELAIVPIVDGVVGPARTWLVKPARPITGFATRIHGITNADVAHAPTIESIADEIAGELDGAIVVAHNAHIDVNVLRRHLPAWQPTAVIDTLKIARRLVPGRASYKLGAMVAEFELTPQIPAGLSPHRAEYDAFACAHLLRRLASPPDQPALTLAQLRGEPPAPEGGEHDDDRLF